MKTSPHPDPFLPLLRRAFRALLTAGAALATLAAAHQAAAQNTTYTFTDGEDGVIWPTVLTDEDCVFDSDITICNESNNALMFTNNYVAAGNASRISDEAMWGNPLEDGSNDPYISIDLSNFFIEEEVEGEFVLTQEVKAISFDFAWANAAGSPIDPPNLDFLNIYIDTWDGDSDVISVPVDEIFTHGLGGSGEGKQAHVTLVASDIPLANIAYIEIQLGALIEEGNGFAPEFAIDNFEVSLDGVTGGPSEVYPIKSDGDPSTGYSTNCLKGVGSFGVGDDVFNNGDQPTTFTVQWVSSDPAMIQPEPQVMVPIEPGETIFDAVRWSIDTDTAPSGTYSGTFTIINDEESSDPDDTIEVISFELYDPPELSDNSGAPIDLGSANAIAVSNAAAGPHPGALRASVLVKELAATNPRFAVAGVAVDDRLDPGASLDGTVGFNAVGATAGVHRGQLRMKMEMTSAIRPFLNRKQPVPDIVWNLETTVAEKTAETKAVGSGENLGEAGIGVSGANTGAAIVDGTSGEAQDITVQISSAPPPPGSGIQVNDPIEVAFTGAVPLYVVQLAYNDADVPPGYAEADLRLEVFDTGAMQWVPAISLNSSATPPAGADPFAGSYATYLSALGGDALDAADLSASGVDPAANAVWAVVDHAGTFRISVGASTLPAKIYGIRYHSGTNTATLIYQSLPGEAFNVFGGETPAASSPLPDTAVGDGSTMEYTHQPPTPEGYFYRMSRK